MNVYTLVSILTFVWLLGIITPVWLLFSYKFYLVREHPVVRARPYRTILSMTLVVAVYIGIFLPLRCVSFLYDDNLLILIEYTIYPFLLHGMYVYWINIVWIVYFNLRSAQIQSMKQWMFILNGQLSNNIMQENIWYLKTENRRRYGNEHWMLTHVWLPFFLVQLAILWSILYIYGVNSTIWFTAEATLYGAKFLLFLFILMQWRVHFNDYYKIRRDFIKSICFAILMGIFFIACNRLYRANIIGLVVFVIATCMIFPIILFVSGMLVIWYPLHVQGIDFSLRRWFRFRATNRNISILKFLEQEERLKEGNPGMLRLVTVSPPPPDVQSVPRVQMSIAQDTLYVGKITVVEPSQTGDTNGPKPELTTTTSIDVGDGDRDRDRDGDKEQKNDSFDEADFEEIFLEIEVSATDLFSVKSENETKTTRATNTFLPIAKIKNRFTRKKSKIIKQQYIRLDKILRYGTGFDAFMNHCLKEFSSENLLCVVECIQYQRFAFDQLWKSDDEVTKIVYTGGNIDEEVDRNQVIKMLRTIKLWKDLPQSEIVFNTQLTIVDKAIKLLEKYIRPSSPYEVNISYQMRNWYMVPYNAHEFPDADSKSWILFFQPVILELVHLMQDSHSRFVRTEDYKQLLTYQKRSRATTGE